MGITGERLYFQTSSGRDETLTRFLSVRDFSRKLTEPLETEDFVVQSMTDASPTRWHLAHTTWFFETFVLNPFDADYQSPDPAYAYLFNSYYVQAGERYPRPDRGLITRPTVREIFEYRECVSRAVSELIRAVDDDTLRKLIPVMEIGIHHEQQHQELLLTDLKHALSFNPLNPVYRSRQIESSQKIPRMRWEDFDEGLYWVGHPGEGFCYDNELPRHRCFVDSFKLADRLITNREYMEFMNDGGYGTAPLWLDEGWHHVQSKGWQAPLYWRREDDEWYQFTLQGFRKVELAEPVCHISFYEADAYARWAGARLPREEEWEVAAESAGSEENSQELKKGGNFVDEENFHPVPLTRTGKGLEQVYGDVWEWTQSPYVGYPGFKASEGALGEYNGKFMVSQMVLRGGSCATSRSHVRSTYRNFFHPSKRWQFTGIRLAK